MSKYWLALLSIILTASAQILMKMGVTSVAADASSVPVALHMRLLRMVFNPHVLGGLAIYGVSTVVWLLAISKLKLSIAYPMVSLSYVIVVTASYLLLGEAVGRNQMIGLGLIILGVIFLVR